MEFLTMTTKVKAIIAAIIAAIYVFTVLGFVIHCKDLEIKLNRCNASYNELKSAVSDQNLAIEKVSDETMARKAKAEQDYKNRIVRPRVSLKGDTLRDVDNSALKALKDEND